MSNVLFVCTANLYRSPLVAACFQRKLKAAGQATGWLVESAGTWARPGQSAPADLVLAAGYFGIDLRAHRTQVISRELLTKHDLILVMEKGHREALNIEFPFVRNKLHLLSEVVNGMSFDILDPIQCRQDIHVFTSECVKFMEYGYRKIWEVSAAMQILKA